MAKTGLFHHIGTFLIFAATILLLITCISAPVVNDIGILKVKLDVFNDGHQSVVSFGSFGYCQLDYNSAGSDYCSGSHIGYKPVDVMKQLTRASFSSAATSSANDLTNAMILHPIACGLAFIAFLFALGAGIFGAVLASAVAFIAWMITVVVMAIDFALFAIIKNDVNKSGTGGHASYSTGMWTCLAAMILLFIGTFWVLFTCLSKRRHSRRTEKFANGTTTTRRRFWQRKTTY